MSKLYIENLKHDITGHDNLASVLLDTVEYLYDKRQDTRAGFYEYLKDISDNQNCFFNEGWNSGSEISKIFLNMYASVSLDKTGLGVNLNSKDQDNKELDSYDAIVNSFEYEYWMPQNDEEDKIAYLATKIGLAVLGIGNPGFKDNYQNNVVDHMIGKNGREVYKSIGYATNKLLQIVIFLMTDPATVDLGGTSENGNTVPVIINTWKTIISPLLTLMSFYFYRICKPYWNVKDMKACLEGYLKTLVAITNKLRKGETTFRTILDAVKAEMSPQNRDICKDILTGQLDMKQTSDFKEFDDKPFDYLYKTESPVAAYNAFIVFLGALGGRRNDRRNNRDNRDSRDSRDDRRGRNDDRRDDRRGGRDSRYRGNDGRDDRRDGRDSRRGGNDDRRGSRRGGNDGSAADFLATMAGGRNDRGRGGDNDRISIDDNRRGGDGRGRNDSRGGRNDSRDNDRRGGRGGRGTPSTADVLRTVS